MLFLFNKNLNWMLHQTETEIMYFGKLISNVFQTIEDMIPEMSFGMTLYIKWGSQYIATFT